MSDYSQVQRQLQIMMILSDHPYGLNVESVHKALRKLGYDVHSRTIRRDLDDLSQCFPIYESEHERPTRFILQRTNLSDISMGFNELQAFRLVHELIKPYKHLDVGINAEKLMQNIIQSLPLNQQNWLLQASPLLQVNLNDLLNERSFNPEFKEILQDAITEHLCVHITYHAFHNNTVGQRTVEPHLLELSEGCYHLWAFCHERQEMRDFRVSRILSVEKTSQVYEPRNELLQVCLKNRFKKMSGQHSNAVKLRFRGFSARMVQEYYMDRADKLEPCQDGSVLFERVVAITPDLIQWILGFGDEVEVLEPESLRESIRKTAYMVLGVYER